MYTVYWLRVTRIHADSSASSEAMEVGLIVRQDRFVTQWKLKFKNFHACVNHVLLLDYAWIGALLHFAFGCHSTSIHQ